MNPITVHETNNKNCNNSRRRHEIRKEYRMYSYVNVIKFKCNYFDDFLYTRRSWSLPYLTTTKNTHMHTIPIDTHIKRTNTKFLHCLDIFLYTIPQTELSWCLILLYYILFFAGSLYLSFNCVCVCISRTLTLNYQN